MSATPVASSRQTEAAEAAVEAIAARPART